MAVLEVETVTAGPYDGGRSFGDAGPYEVRRLRFTHRVDPSHKANLAVTDLEHAETDADGLVTFSHEVLEFRPDDPTRANGRLLVDVVNRGRPTAFRFINQEQSAAFPPPDIPKPGDGHLLRLGWTVWCVGWQFDINHQSLIGLDAPEALQGGQSISGAIDYTAQPPAATDRLRLALPGHSPAAPVSDGPATMWETGDDGLTFSEVPTEAWSFDPNRRYALREGGFEAGRRYRIRYTTDRAPIAGCGLLALRDSASWAKAHHGFHTTVLFGASQCGRVIRQILADGLLVDEQGLAVYDGVMPLIAGARVGQFNQRFSNPGILPMGSEGLEGRKTYGELLATVAAEARPKVMALNTSHEYWRGDAALAHEPPGPVGDEHVRVHFAAGTPHAPGNVPQQFSDAYFGTKGVVGFSTVNYGPIVRALLGQLVEWIDGTAQPAANTTPTPAQTTGRDVVLRAMSDCGWPVPVADSFGLPSGPVVGVNADGNEVGGIRLPDIAVPIGVHTGWNVRHPDCGAPSFQLLLTGATRWFDKAEIERRYGDRDRYLAAVEAAIDSLVDGRFALPDDRDGLRRQAADRWDEATAAS